MSSKEDIARVELGDEEVLEDDRRGAAGRVPDKDLNDGTGQERDSD